MKNATMKATEGIGRAFFCSMINREVIILHEIIKKTQKTHQGHPACEKTTKGDKMMSTDDTK